MSRSMPAAQNHIQVAHSQKLSKRHLILFRHIFLPEDSAEAFILHCEPDYPLCGYLLSVYSCVLPPRTVGGEDSLGNCHPRLTDPLLHLSYRGDPGDLPDAAPAGALPLVLHGAGGGECLSRHHSSESALQKAKHSQNAYLGQKYSHSEDAWSSAYESSKTGK